MFNNISSKIKKLAKVLCWIGIIAACFCALSYFSAEQFFLGIAIGLLGSVLSWVGCFVLYGFGQLIENSYEILDEIKKSNRLKKLSTETDSKEYYPSKSGVIKL
jgi:hypothetical protein